MARAGIAVHEAVNVAGRDATELSQRVSQVLEETGAYRVVQISPTQHQLVRTFRPTWATAVGVLGLIGFGLGILVLLVRRTESCTIGVVHGSTGAVVTIDGFLLPAHLELAKRAIAGRTDSASMNRVPAASPPAVVAPSIVASPPAPASAVSDVTVARSLPVLGGQSDMAIQMADGRRVPVDGLVVIGRDPSLEAVDGGRATLVAVADPDLSISKTHLAIEAVGDALVVTDLHSTNGTQVAFPDGTRGVVTPGIRSTLVAGAVLHFGSHTAEVVDG